MSIRGMKPWGSLARVWYRYLQLAIKTDQPINWDYYKDWGDKESIASISFNKWWKEIGKDLFTPTPLGVEQISSDSSYVTVRIPLNIRKEDAYSQIGRILTDNQSKGSMTDLLKYAPTGRVNANTLIRYQRMVEIDLNPKLQGKPFKVKAEALLKIYEKNKERLIKQATTLRAKNRRLMIKLPNTAKLKGKERATKNEYQMIDIRVAHRWLTQGRKILKNVAMGEFPGSGYY
jgi:hypothetical protein